MLSIGKHKKRLEAGDTIVEVLIVLAVLSFAFAIASSTAARGLRQSRVAQEHSYAQGLLTSQMEQLKRVVGNPSDSGTLPAPGTEFCMLNGKIELTACQNSQNDTDYIARIKFFGTSATAPDAYYELQVGWDGQGDMGKQREIMRYRVHQVSKTVNPGVVLSAGEPAISVKVSKIKPVSRGTDANGKDLGVSAPPCTDSSNTANLENKNGAFVSLKHTNGSNDKGSVETGSGLNPASTVVFNQLVTENGTYVANMTPPSGFDECAPNPSAAVTAKGGTTVPIAMYFTPQCKLETRSWQKEHFKDVPVYETRTRTVPTGTYGKGVRYGDPLYPAGGPADGRRSGDDWTETVYTNKGGYYYEKGPDIDDNDNGRWFNLWLSRAETKEEEYQHYLRTDTVHDYWETIYYEFGLCN